ncbi:MAG: hypothetical protein IPN36_07905 [Bacteroidetes bacterium]|nr:hypothetical protein [Bacteroidota bacterium]
MSGKQPHILYTVLNWGLGHATRSIPVIKEFIRQNTKVSLAGEGDSLFLLRSEFPTLEHYEIKGVDVRYPGNMPLALAMVLQSFKINTAIKREHQQFTELAKKIKPDAIISDNRYGAYTDGIPSVLICHQLQLKAPDFLRFTEPLLLRFNRIFLRPFSEIWVPDMEGSANLTGDLSHSSTALRTLQPEFIGPLSRLKDAIISDTQKRYDIFVTFSGPEPQRSIFEEQLLLQLKELPYSVLMVTGQPQKNSGRTIGNVDMVPHLTPGELKFHFIHSNYIVCRAGHSTLMDLCAFKRSALVIPTPGQTEQEYLAGIHAQAGNLVTFAQNKMDIASGIKILDGCQPLNLPVNELIAPRITRFLKSLKT